MSSVLHTVRPEDSIGAAFKKRSILGELYLRLEDLKVRQARTHKEYLHTTTPDSPRAEAVDPCLRPRIGALSVLRDGALVGIITETDMLRALRDHLDATKMQEKA